MRRESQKNRRHGWKKEREESSEREMKVGQERSIKHISLIIYTAQKVFVFFLLVNL